MGVDVVLAELRYMRGLSDVISDIQVGEELLALSTAVLWAWCEDAALSFLPHMNLFLEQRCQFSKGLLNIQSCVLPEVRNRSART